MTLTSNNSYDWPCCVTKLNGKLILQGVSSRIGNQTDILPAEMCRSLPERMLTKSNMATVDSSIVFDIYTTPPCAHFLMKHHSKLLFISCIYIFYDMAQPEEVYSQCMDSLKADHFDQDWTNVAQSTESKIMLHLTACNWDYHKIDTEGWQTCE